MGKLDILPGHVFLDLGCGSGAVSKAASRYTNKIYGIDVREEAVDISKAKVPGGIFLCGNATEHLPQLPPINRCFIGGTRQIDAFFPQASGESCTRLHYRGSACQNWHGL